MMWLWGILGGMLATWVMDQIAFLLVRKQIIHLHGLQIVPPLLGRWVLAMKSSIQFVTEDIRNLPAGSHEKQIGWMAHFAIGATLGIVFFKLSETFPNSKEETLFLGMGFGILTNAFPWLMMYPAMGFGFFASRMPMQKALLGFSFLNHCVFGLALGVSLYVTRSFVGY
ncbi:MAG: DUF2938 family protein [Pseudobdellovibrionaceae bacterium]